MKSALFANTLTAALLVLVPIGTQFSAQAATTTCPLPAEPIALDLQTAKVAGVIGNGALYQYQTWELDVSAQKLSVDGIAMEVTSNLPTCSSCSISSVNVFYDDGSSSAVNSSTTMVDLPRGKGRSLLKITAGHGGTGLIQQIKSLTVRPSDQAVYFLSDSSPTLPVPSTAQNPESNGVMTVSPGLYTIYPVGKVLESIDVTGNRVRSGGPSYDNDLVQFYVYFYTTPSNFKNVAASFNSFTQTVNVKVPTSLVGQSIQSVGLSTVGSGVSHSIRRIDIKAVTPSAQAQTLPPGWSLVGNGSGAAIDVVAFFGNTTTPKTLSASVISIWSWNGTLNRWNFFAPSMTAQELASYAASKGFGVLSSIAKGEGFWVNAKNQFVYDPGAPVTP